jgi:hypothetical protein
VCTVGDCLICVPWCCTVWSKVWLVSERNAGSRGHYKEQLTLYCDRLAWACRVLAAARRHRVQDKCGPRVSASLLMCKLAWARACPLELATCRSNLVLATSPMIVPEISPFKPRSMPVPAQAPALPAPVVISPASMLAPAPVLAPTSAVFAVIQAAPDSPYKPMPPSAHTTPATLATHATSAVPMPTPAPGPHMCMPAAGRWCCPGKCRLLGACARTGEAHKPATAPPQAGQLALMCRTHIGVRARPDPSSGGSVSESELLTLNVGPADLPEKLTCVGGVPTWCGCAQSLAVCV